MTLCSGRQQPTTENTFPPTLLLHYAPSTIRLWSAMPNVMYALEPTFSLPQPLIPVPEVPQMTKLGLKALSLLLDGWTNTPPMKRVRYVILTTKCIVTCALMPAL